MVECYVGTPTTGWGYVGQASCTTGATPPHACSISSVAAFNAGNYQLDAFGYGNNGSWIAMDYNGKGLSCNYPPPTCH